MLVAVYGSLRKGMGNHAVISQDLNRQHLSTERIKGWDMYSYGAFPYISPGEGSIVVEVYDLAERTLEQLDRLEGYPYFYDRTRVETSQGPAWIYFINQGSNNRPVKNGDWVRHVKGD